MSTREQNEKKFPNWQSLENGRRYWLEVKGRHGWLARYVKEVDAQEMTVRFYQEIFDENGGSRPSRGITAMETITRQVVADKLSAYLRHEISSSELVDWAESALMEGEFEPQRFDDVRNVIARLGVIDVRAFGLTWEDCERLLNQLGYVARVSIVAT